MATEVRGIVIEALVSNPALGMGVTGIVIEALVSNPALGMGVTGIVIEALVSNPALGMGVTGMIIEALVGPIIAVETGLQGAVFVDRPFQGTGISRRDFFEDS